MTGISMGRREVLAAAAALAAGPAFGQAATDTNPKVAMKTGQGVIVIELAQDKAPITVGNFLRYVDHRRMDGSSFYRAVRTVGAPPNFGLIEGGLQNDPAKLYPPIAHESTLKTGLKHLDGTISMARLKPGTATADFFICCGPAPSLDADPTAPGDNAGFAAFGQVIDGMDAVHAILNLPTNGFARNPVMKGQMLSPSVPIISVRRI